MTSKNRLFDYLRHMFEAAEQAHSYVEGMDKAAWHADKRTQQAVILNLLKAPLKNWPFCKSTIALLISKMATSTFCRSPKH